METDKESMGKHNPGQRHGISTSATNQRGNSNTHNNAILAGANGFTPYKIRRKAVRNSRRDRRGYGAHGNNNQLQGDGNG